MNINIKTYMSGSAGIFDLIPRFYLSWHFQYFAVGMGWGRWFIEFEKFGNKR